MFWTTRHLLKPRTPFGAKIVLTQIMAKISIKTCKSFTNLREEGSFYFFLIFASPFFEDCLMFS